MIRIRKIPFLISPAVEFNTERPIVLPNYQASTIDEMYYQSGNTVRMKDPWEKYQISLRMGDKVMDHFLLTNVIDKKLGEFPLYPVLTIVQHLNSKKERAVPILHKRGIAKVYELLNYRKPQNFLFLGEIFLEHLKREITNQLYSPSLLDDCVLDILDECLYLTSLVHTENHAEQLCSVNMIIQELTDLCYSGMRHSEFPTRPLIEEVLSPLFPAIPQEMLYHPISNVLMSKEEIGPTEICGLMKKHHIDIDQTAELDGLMQQRILASDFDMDDIGYYPEFIRLYQTLIESGYTNIYLEYVFQEDSTKPNYLEWIPTNKSIEMINEYRSDERDLEKEQQLIFEIEDVLMGGNFLTDVSLDLESEENEVYDEETKFQIKKIEVIVRDNSACVTLYSWALSCTAHLDFTVMALLSNSLVSN